jgi:hypothetical protein
MIRQLVAHFHGEPALLCTPEEALIPLGVSERLREHPVTTFPEAMVTTQESPGDRLRTVKGLSEELTACFEENRMPENLGSPE